MSLGDVLHEIVTLAAGEGARPDLHEAIDELEPAAVSAPDSAEAEAAPGPVSDEPVAAPEAAPVDDGPQVQEHAQEDGSAEVDA